MDKIGVRLRESREARGLNQEAFAALGGVSRNAQFNYEAGKRAPDSEYLHRIADAGVDVAYVLTGQPSITDLTERETRFLSAIRKMGDEWFELILPIAEKIAGELEPTLHEDRMRYRSG